jgi:uracil-DNA glycosylase family 4
MFNRILSCQKCSLSLSQKPLLVSTFNVKRPIMVVGISAKITHFASESPLDGRTPSGRIIDSMESIANDMGLSIYRTNLVKCAPIDSSSKLRYPTTDEITACIDNLIFEIEVLDPPLVILLGSIVQTALENKLNMRIGKVRACSFPLYKHRQRYYVASYHPSYVARSKKRSEMYLMNFSAMLNSIIPEISE